MRGRALALALLLASGGAAGHAAGRLDLIEAVKAGDREAVRVLARQRPALEATEPDGTSALHWAVRRGDHAIADLLLRSGANANTANRYGVTPLSLAARNGDAELIRRLLAAGATVNAAEATLPERQTLLMLAAPAGDVASLEALLAAGSNPNGRESRTGTTALVWAASSNRGDAVRALVAGGADPNLLSTVTAYPHTQAGVLLTGLEEGVSYVGQTVLPKGGWSAVMYAAREGAVDAVRALAESGANLDLTDPEGTTALVIGVINGHANAVSMLLDKGANPNIADIKGMTPLYAAVDMHTIANTFGRPYPTREVIEGSVGMASRLLTAGANPNARLKAPILKRVYDAGDGRLGEGSTPLMRAARKCDAVMMKVLLAAGADVSLTQKNGNTALMLCAGAVSAGDGEDNAERVSEQEALAAVRLALDAGADVNAASGNGDTALHTAASTAGGVPSVIRLLVDRGGRLDVKNKAGRTPLDAALRARQRNEQTIALLRELGAVASDQR